MARPSYLSPVYIKKVHTRLEGLHASLVTLYNWSYDNKNVSNADLANLLQMLNSIACQDALFQRLIQHARDAQT